MAGKMVTIACHGVVYEGKLLAPEGEMVQALQWVGVRVTATIETMHAIEQRSASSPVEFAKNGVCGDSSPVV